ncbi:hypothetical protein [Acinetobacter sp. ANC 3813]|uniref:hypothetical protein n=1 Tax=Acinetobacter sp. ANC 3813 TaxID=1977873 RepID=UPI000B6270BF|nr:hypothetical protein [Acinetobacter sp. ANC 3813]OTG90934.1 hypothetical protein B9T34_06060 [Acinetobacter sp. ANC 3813]
MSRLLIAAVADITELALGLDILIADLGERKRLLMLELGNWHSKQGINFDLNKFKPYIGVGIMFAYFNDIKPESATGSDLKAAVYMIQNK